MTRVFRSPAAERDLEDIWLTIATDNPTAATRMVRALGARIDQLAEHPRLGPRRRDLRPTVRVLVGGHISYFLKHTPTLTRVRSTRSRSSASWTVGVT